MGRRNRERLKRIKDGTELPRSATDPARRPGYLRFFRCRKCRHTVIESGLEQHKQQCKTTGFDFVNPNVRARRIRLRKGTKGK